MFNSIKHTTIIAILSVVTLVFLTVRANALSLVMVDDNPGDGLITFTLTDPVGDRFWDGSTGAAIDVISAEFRITPLVSGKTYGTIDVFLTAPNNELFSRSVWLNMTLTNETASTRVNGAPGYGSELWTQSAEVQLPLDQQNNPIATTLIHHTFGTTQVTNWLDGDTIAYYVEAGTYINNNFDHVSSMFVRSNGILNNLDYIGVTDINNPNAPVPEPSTIILLGAGLLGLVAYGRKRSKI